MLETLQNKIGLWAYRKFQSLQHIHRQPLGAKIEWLFCSFLEYLCPKCEEKDCNNRGEPCRLYDDEHDKDLIFWYCSEHAQRNGFCFGCGEFCGGSESFDFGPGWCSNCASEFEDDENEPEGWEDAMFEEGLP